MIFISGVLISTAIGQKIRTSHSRGTHTFDAHNAEEYGHLLGDIDLSKYITQWNFTMGAPPRGWYKLKFDAENGVDSNTVLRKSGESGQTMSTFNFDEFGEEHYCRYRKSEDGDQCCDGEDQNCYTKAGCFCDIACFTVYGDCCTDHFVSCYDDLRLCLRDNVKVENKEEQTSEGKQNIKALAPRSHNKDVLRQDFTSPTRVEPDSCCGQTAYNKEEDCCVERGGQRTTTGKACPGYGDTEEETEEEEEGYDSRYESPEPAGGN